MKFSSRCWAWGLTRAREDFVMGAARSAQGGTLKGQHQRGELIRRSAQPRERVFEHGQQGSGVI